MADKPYSILKSPPFLLSAALIIAKLLGWLAISWPAALLPLLYYPVIIGIALLTDWP